MASTSSQQTFQTLHKSQLVEMLHTFLLDGNYGPAASILSILAKFVDKLPEEIWKAGVEVLRREGAPSHDCTQFFQHMISLFPKQVCHVMSCSGPRGFGFPKHPFILGPVGFYLFSLFLFPFSLH
jgi:hypothetical protein